MTSFAKKLFGFLDLDRILFTVLAMVLIIHALSFLPSNFDSLILITVVAVATLQVIIGALQELKEKKISIDLLASIALIFS